MNGRVGCLFGVGLACLLLAGDEYWWVFCCLCL